MNSLTIQAHQAARNNNQMKLILKVVKVI